MNPNDFADVLPQLRQRAVDSLAEGCIPNPGRYNSSEALRVLCRLALEQGTAPDALALLHELQVHQVELELQNEELVASRLAAEEVARQQAFLFDRAPMGYLLIDDRGVIRKANQAAAELLGVDRLTLCGVPLSVVLTPESHVTLMEMVGRAVIAAPSETRVLRALPGVRGDGELHATVGRNAQGDGCLLALMAAPLA